MNEYKSFNKLFFVLAAAFTCMAIRSVYGASGVIGPKKVYTLAYTTTVTTITPTISSFGVVAAAQYAPGAVYQIIQGTTNAGGLGVEYFMLYDSSFTQNVAGNTITCGAYTGLPTGVTALTPRMVYTTSFTVVTRFDPPLLFTNGLVGCNSAVADAVSISYELGRGLSGQ